MLWPSDPDGDIALISRSGLFDAAWYLEHCPDVSASNMDPVKHYVLYGQREGRSPNSDLRLDDYIETVTPAAIGSFNPLVHYIMFATPDNDIAIIARSGLFDVDWYLENNRDVRASDIDPVAHYVLYGEKEGRSANKKIKLDRYILNVTTEVIGGRSPLAHYILFGKPEQLIDPGNLTSLSLNTLKTATDRLGRLPIYAPADYVELNQDLQSGIKQHNIDPANHAITYGVPEGRRIFKNLRIAQVLGESARRPFPPPKQVQPQEAAPPLPPIGVYYNASGNVFIRELAQEIVDALALLGLDVSLLDDTGPRQLLPVSIIVAPHEFFHIGKGPKWVREEIVSQALMYNTEQPQTPWFERALPFILASRGVIDICYQIADIFQQSEMPAIHFNPNATPTEDWLLDEDREHAFFRILPKAAKSQPKAATAFLDRPIDISFFGSVSRRREMFFSRNAGFLADYQAFLYYRKFLGPLKADGRDGVLARLGRHVTAHSKISLNIHRDELGFFEWHRIVKLGMLGGSIVVTEPCLPHPVFKPGLHYLEENTRHMPDLIEWLIKSKDGNEKAAAIKQNIADITNPAHARANSLALAHFIKNLY